jgi:ATP-dependent exoDNAse (exonuclease V) alpha subunit
MNSYEELLNYLINTIRNVLILGPAGCGKTEIIKRLKKKEINIIFVAPSGIASENINGRTIQSFFGIMPYTYTADNNSIISINSNKIIDIKNAQILLIDEISMLRLEILDIVDFKLRHIRNSNLPFGGLRLIFFGDIFQIEPVTQYFEESFLSRYYESTGGNYNFYNSDVMKNNNFFNNTFEIFELQHDFRHQDDIQFRDILLKIRQGKITDKIINILNTRYIPKMIYDENYQYLTITNATASKINEHFLEKIKASGYTSFAEMVKMKNDYNGDLNNIKCPFSKRLVIKENMKIMFVKNDNRSNEHRWVNGAIGKVIKINTTSGHIDSVLIEIISNGKIVVVEKEKYDLMDKVIKYGKEIIEKVGEIIQFPFVPAYAITIDKSQGLTLDKVVLVLEKRTRDNQIYVALSRVRKFKDIFIFGRKLRMSDIHISRNIKVFNENIRNRIIPVFHNIVNFNNITINYGTQIIKNIFSNNIEKINV